MWGVDRKILALSRIGWMCMKSVDRKMSCRLDMHVNRKSTSVGLYREKMASAEYALGNHID